jgi:orotate phosphoribosyltransferase
LSPNHAWRHTFKAVADRCGIPEKMTDAICGHALGAARIAYILAREQKEGATCIPKFGLFLFQNLESEQKHGGHVFPGNCGGVSD